MAGSGSPSPTRISAPVFGSVMPTVNMRAICWGALQVVPPSVDLTKAAKYWVFARLFGFTIQAVKSYRAPVIGLTTITLPIVWLFWAVGKMTLAGLQVFPPSVVFEK